MKSRFVENPERNAWARTSVRFLLAIDLSHAAFADVANAHIHSLCPNGPQTRSFLLLVVKQGATSSFLLLVAMPFVTSSDGLQQFCPAFARNRKTLAQGTDHPLETEHRPSFW